MSYSIVSSPTFLRQLRGLPHNDVPLILEAIDILGRDRQPDGGKKIELKGCPGVYRLRKGDYRILYTYKDKSDWVALLAVEKRKDSYKRKIQAQAPSSSLPSQEALARSEREAMAALQDDEQDDEYVPAPVADETRPSTETHQEAADLLPRPLDPDFLRRLGVPGQHIAALAACKTGDDLMKARVPEPIRELVLDNLTKPDYDQLADGPKLIVHHIDDLRRHAEGELVTFLLKLDEEQEQFVRWRVGQGPALLKGGPGTGKTVIALYRARAVLSALRETGIAQPRILVTTYTNALVNAAQELLATLLGKADASLVDVRTVDSLVAEIVRSAGLPAKSADDGIVLGMLEKAMQRLHEGSDEDRNLAASIAHLSRDYVREEIERVIIGRELDALDAYLAEERRGRRVRLSPVQRRAVWRVMEVWQGLMRQKNHPPTFAQNRRRAADLVRSGHLAACYDAVIIDEAQDLDPVAIRMLLRLCKPSGDILITADGNQSIYGAGFSWKRVHEDLQFRGRTGVLRKNYRSTKELARALASYLHGAEADEEIRAEQEAVRSGPQPSVLRLANPASEAEMLVSWLWEAARRQRVGLGCLAVLVPTNQIGENIAHTLTRLGMPARFMPSNQVQLEPGEVKVLTFHAAKGLEFPVVAVAGLYPGGQFLAPPAAGAEQAEEKLLLNRRVLYVAMGRAMRELRVFVPAGHDSPLLAGFDESLWLVLETHQAKAA